jgi:hypothetical protein
MLSCGVGKRGCSDMEGATGREAAATHDAGGAGTELAETSMLTTPGHLTFAVVQQYGRLKVRIVFLFLG